MRRAPPSSVSSSSGSCATDTAPIAFLSATSSENLSRKAPAAWSPPRTSPVALLTPPPPQGVPSVRSPSQPLKVAQHLGHLHRLGPLALGTAGAAPSHGSGCRRDPLPRLCPHCLERRPRVELGRAVAGARAHGRGQLLGARRAAAPVGEEHVRQQPQQLPPPIFVTAANAANGWSTESLVRLELAEVIGAGWEALVGSAEAALGLVGAGVAYLRLLAEQRWEGGLRAAALGGDYQPTAVRAATLAALDEAAATGDLLRLLPYVLLSNRRCGAPSAKELATAVRACAGNRPPELALHALSRLRLREARALGAMMCACIPYCCGSNQLSRTGLFYTDRHFSQNGKPKTAKRTRVLLLRLETSREPDDIRRQECATPIANWWLGAVRSQQRKPSIQSATPEPERAGKGTRRTLRSLSLRVTPEWHGVSARPCVQHAARARQASDGFLPSW